ncbi:hypothetical protein ACIQZB_24965 [Streptomyces sp. NPDC097727]|uniref:hypothetical protein n=1 Tax=Streptomyces sp. NPDC097727 TaxID=3366092 RepID=UPI0038026F05
MSGIYAAPLTEPSEKNMYRAPVVRLCDLHGSPMTLPRPSQGRAHLPSSHDHADGNDRQDQDRRNTSKVHAGSDGLQVTVIAQLKVATRE